MKEKTKRLIKELKKLGIEVSVLAPDPIVQLKLGERKEYLIRDHVPLGNDLYGELINNKNLTKKILKKIGIKTPKGFLASSFKEVQDGVKKNRMKLPLVVKPHNRALGKGVIANITNWDELKKSVGVIKKQNYVPFLVEEYFQGDDYRFLVLQGKIIAVAKRIPPFVVGDGKKTLGALIDDLNRKKSERKKLKIDVETLRNIKKHKLSLSDIIKKGKIIKLRENANRSTGGFSEDVTGKAHQKFKNIAIRAAREFNIGYVGVDILAQDVVKKDSKYVLLEVNDLPGVDLHERVDIGEKKDIAPFLAKAILEEIKNEI